MTDKPDQAKVAAAMSHRGEPSGGVHHRLGGSWVTLRDYDRANERVVILAAQVVWQEDENERLKEMLRKVQWYDNMGGTSKWHHWCVGCDYSHGTDGKSHAADCPFDNVLAKPTTEDAL